MRVLFICGSLEPNRDGVGDYTRRLAGDLIRQGHEAAAIALNDRHYEGNPVQMNQETVGVSVPVLRLSSKIAWRDRIKSAKSFISLMPPKRISLQYVPYAFHPKGVPIRLPRRLNRIGGGHRWHIMFHELSIDFGLPLSLKERITALLQKRVIKDLCRHLKPIAVSTHAADYENKLTELVDILIERLPLFSNIPLGNINRSHCCSLLNISEDQRSTFLIGTLFGNIHPGALAEEAITRFETAAFTRNKIPYLVHAGRIPARAEEEWSLAMKQAPEGFRHLRLGGLAEDDLSYLIQASDLGISTTPWTLAEKSGSVAAFLEAGKHVWFLQDSLPGFPPEIEGISLDLESCLSGKTFHRKDLSQIAARFIKSLEG